jgi:hypothetical protein
MRVNASSFFSFCGSHVPLLRALTERAGEISEAEVFRAIRAHPGDSGEMPETTWRRLRELQILIVTEPDSDFYLVAEPVARLLAYLFDEAKAATPEIIQGYIRSLDSLAKRLVRMIESDDVTGVGLAFEEITTTLRRIHADIEETQRSVLTEVGRYKTERQRVSVREKYRRIVHWMERYVEPMIEIVRADGPLRGTFDEVEGLLRQTRERALFNDHPALDRNLRHLRLVRQHALRTFNQCRKEIGPLYESLRRSSFIAEGAAIALASLQRDGLANWGAQPLIGVFALRFQHVPGDAAIALALRRVIEHPPEAAPNVEFDTDTETPVALLQRLWLDSLPELARQAGSTDDLLGWLIEQNPSRATAEILSGFTELLFRDEFTAYFSDVPARDYSTPDGELTGHPVRLATA